MNSAQEIADGILQLLDKRGQLGLLGEVIDILESANAGRNRFNTAVIRTAVVLQNDEREILKTKLSEMFGRQLQLEEHLDESIIGGMYIQVGDTVLDYTLSSHLHQTIEQIEK